MRKLPTFVVCAGFCFGFISAANSQVEIRVVTTFDFGVGNSTTPHDINNLGQVIGTATNPGGVSHNFLRLPNGSFKRVIGFGETDYIYAQGLNNSQIFCGYIFVGFGYYGYWQDGKAMYTVGFGSNGANTYFSGINDNNDLVGAFQATDSNSRVGKHSIDDYFYDITIPGSTYVDGNGINNAGDVVGEYYDAPPATTYHGYTLSGIRDYTYPIDYPGAASTALLGLNNFDQIVGEWIDDNGAKHGLLFRPPSTFISFDYPGASATSLTGINDSGVLCGSYTDEEGIDHGLVAKVIR